MLKKVGLVLVVVVVAFIGLIATRPAKFHVERKAAIDAPADVVFAQINDFHAWEAWSPWAKLDPAMKATYTGPESGVGAKYAWESDNGDVGSGTMTITASKPSEQVVIDLAFLKPFEAHNVTTFSTGADGTKTNVSWSMDGDNSFMGKAMSLVMSMDEMIGKDFEKGLSQLRSTSEAKAKALAEEAAKKAAEAAAAAAAAAPVPAPTP